MPLPRRPAIVYPAAMIELAALSMSLVLNLPMTVSMQPPAPDEGRPRRIEVSAQEGNDAQAQHHHHQPPSDATDDATMTHSFDDVNEWVARFDDPARAEWQKPEEVVAALGLSAGMSAADIGAGTGYFERFLSRAVGPEGKVYAVDLEPKMVEYMKQRAIREETPNVIPQVAEPEDPKLADGSVDRILIVDTYHHINNRLDYFGRLKKALRPGGRVAIVDFKKKELPVGPPVEHKLERGQIVDEMQAAGYHLASEPDFLPYQNFLIFEVGS